MMKKSNIFAAIFGNIMEWYDFTLYIFLAPVLAQNFFTQQSHLNALLSTFMIFAIGFFVRPLGSILFGHLGDRWGRSTTLKLSILFISISTLGIALLPNNQSWGIYAALGLCFLRLIQGFCIGGEFAGSIIYLSEMAPANRRALASCMSNNGSNIGVLAATLIAATTANVMSENTFYQYGWRLPFLLGGVIGLIGLWLRRDLSETPIYHRLATQARLPRLPLLTVLRFHKKEVINIFLLVIMAATGSYALMDFMSNYLHQYFHYSLSEALTIQSLYNALTFILVTAAAKLCDHYGRRSILLAAAIGYLLFSIPCFYFLNAQGSWLWLLPLVTFYCLEQASTPVTIIEIFPAQARYTGVSLGYNLAMALVGGTAPMINTWLVAKFNNPLIIAYYLMVGAALALMVIIKKLPREFGIRCELV